MDLIKNILELDCRECYKHRTSLMVEKLRPGLGCMVMNCGMVTMGELLPIVARYMRNCNMSVWFNRLEEETLRSLIVLMRETCHVEHEGKWVDLPLVSKVRIYTPVFEGSDYPTLDMGEVARLNRDGRFEVMTADVNEEMVMLMDAEFPRAAGRSLVFKGDEIPQRRNESKRVTWMKMVMG